MKPTRADLMFYTLKTTPAWAQKLSLPMRCNIDDVIESREEVKYAQRNKLGGRHSLDLGNVLNVLSFRQFNGELRIKKIREWANGEAVGPKSKSYLVIGLRLLRRYEKSIL